MNIIAFHEGGDMIAEGLKRSVFLYNYYYYYRPTTTTTVTIDTSTFIISLNYYYFTAATIDILTIHCRVLLLLLSKSEAYWSRVSYITFKCP